jgi:putative oxidoreductase
MESVLGVLPLNPMWVDLSLLLLRLTVAVVYFASGWGYLADPQKRSKSIGMGKSFTIFLGLAEISGALGLAFGVLIQFAAAGLILLMLGAVYKKMFVWKTGFWGTISQGWHYDLIFIAANLVIITTDGGKYILWK